jgi:hypothetical protein
MPRAAPRHAEPADLCGWRVDDFRGVRVGTLASVYEDFEAGVPAWLLVRLARYSTRFVLAPPADVLAWPGRVCLPYDRLRIERAPLLYAAPPEIGPELEEQLRAHYRLIAGSDVGMTARRSVA